MHDFARLEIPPATVLFALKKPPSVNPRQPSPPTRNQSRREHAAGKEWVTGADMAAFNGASSPLCHKPRRFEGQSGRDRWNAGIATGLEADASPPAEPEPDARSAGQCKLNLPLVARIRPG
jgi:hypothetical protein